MLGCEMSPDRVALEILGFIFGGVTAAVVVVACTVVLSHVEGRIAIDAPSTSIAASQ